MVERLADPAGAPPLSTWWLSGALVAFVIIGLWLWISGGKEKSNPFLASESCELTSKFNIADDKQSIIAVGTSLLAFSTEPAKQFETSLRDMRWSSCKVPYGSWGDLVHALPTIAALKPKILILHEGVLTDSNRSALQKLFDEVSAKIRTALGWGLPNQDLKRPACSLDGPAAATTYAMLLKPQNAIFSDATAWIRRLQVAGIHVIVLDIPRSATLESQLRPLLAQRKIEVQKLASDSGAQYWSFAAPSGPHAYCKDQSHMDLDGRNQFSAQLAERLQHSFPGLFQ